MNKFRTLNAEEIEVRPQSVKNGKATMLLYIDSRCVTNILDETVGCMNWQSEFYEVNGQTMGKLGIWDELKNMWIWKSDTGSESNIEGEKGLISDCYKRLLSRWGVTELYSAPRITWDDDGYGNTGYKVTEIQYDDNRKITHLVIANRFGKEQFRWDKTQVIQMVSQRTQTYTQTQDELEWKDDRGPLVVTDYKAMFTDYCTELKNGGADRAQLKKFYDYYIVKMAGWKGNLNPSALWQRWNTPKAS